jgi:hypothetical protein
MSEGTEAGKATTATPAAPNAPSPPGGTTGETPARPKWGTQRTSKEAWVDVADLAGKPFTIVKVYQTSVGQAKFVFDLGGEGFVGKKMSVRVEGSSIGDQIAREGLPPIGFAYTVDKNPSKSSPTGYSLTLRQL